MSTTILLFWNKKSLKTKKFFFVQFLFCWLFARLKQKLGPVLKNSIFIFSNRNDLHIHWIQLQVNVWHKSSWSCLRSKRLDHCDVEFSLIGAFKASNTAFWWLEALRSTFWPTTLPSQAEYLRACCRTLRSICFSDRGDKHDRGLSDEFVNGDKENSRSWTRDFVVVQSPAYESVVSWLEFKTISRHSSSRPMLLTSSIVESTWSLELAQPTKLLTSKQSSLETF